MRPEAPQGRDNKLCFATMFVIIEYWVEQEFDVEIIGMINHQRSKKGREKTYWVELYMKVSLIYGKFLHLLR